MRPVVTKMDLSSFVARSPEYGTLAEAITSNLTTRLAFTFFPTVDQSTLMAGQQPLRMGFVNSQGAPISCLLASNSYYPYIWVEDVKHYLIIDLTPNASNSVESRYNIIVGFPYFTTTTTFDTTKLDEWLYATNSGNLYLFEVIIPVFGLNNLLVQLDLTNVTFNCNCSSCTVGQYCNPQTVSCQDCTVCGQGNGVCYGPCGNSFANNLYSNSNSYGSGVYGNSASIASSSSNEVCGFVNGVYACIPYYPPTPSEPPPPVTPSPETESGANVAIIIGVIVIFIFLFVALLFITLAIRGRGKGGKPSTGGSSNSGGTSNNTNGNIT